jgi:hypothetical protein
VKLSVTRGTSCDSDEQPDKKPVSAENRADPDSATAPTVTLPPSNATGKVSNKNLNCSKS